jgi:hypothetical protein
MLPRTRFMLEQKPRVRYHVASRGTRRRFVFGLYGMTFLGVVPFLVIACSLDGLRTIATPSNFGIAFIRFYAFQVITFGIAMYCFFALARCWSWVAASSDDILIDERMQTRKNQALAYSFNALTIVCTTEAALWVGSVVWSRYASGLTQLPLETQIVSSLLGFNAFLAITMPMSILAWIEPDPVDELGSS